MIEHLIRSPQDPWYTEMEALYYAAFPESELVPLQDLAQLLRGAGKAMAFIDDAGKQPTFAGGTFAVVDQKFFYLMYLAVPERARSRGYGSAILELLDQSYPNHTHVLEIESLHEPNGNHRQRVRREAFYQAHGFSYIPVATQEPGGRFDFMARNGTANFAEIVDLYDRLIGADMVARWETHILDLAPDRT